MPRLRAHLTVAPYLMVVALVLICSSALLAQPAGKPAAKPPKTVTWTLAQGTVVDAGQTIRTADGLKTTGYTVQAAATSQGQARVRAGLFTMKCTIQEKGGKFQLRGAWDITETGSRKTTHRTPHSIRGTLVANLAFNPAVGGTGPINGDVLVTPRRRHAGMELKAQGPFTSNEKFEGTLTITRRR